MFFLKSLIYLLLAAVLFAGCAGTKPPVNSSQTVAAVGNKDSVQEGEFDPLQLNDMELNLPVKSNSNSYYRIEDFIKSERSDSSSSDEMVAGYRVQLISTRQETEARTIKKDAVLTFEENVYTIFDNPYYKIRVGDCLTRYDANTLQELAVKKGFNEAWVVKTNIYRKPVLQHLSRDIQE